MKRILSTLVCLVLTFIVAPTSAFAIGNESVNLPAYASNSKDIWSSPDRTLDTANSQDQDVQIPSKPSSNPEAGSRKIFRAQLVSTATNVPVVFAETTNVISAQSVEAAIAWAKDTLNPYPNASYMGKCGAFVFQAYHTGAGLSGVTSASTAKLLGDILITHTDSNPPRGALVFWYADVSAGHVALSLGNGKVIHPWGSNGAETYISTVTNYYEKTKGLSNNYRGWGSPIKGYSLATVNITCPHTFSSSGICTKCLTPYNWAGSYKAKTVILKPAAGKTVIELKNIPYGAGTVVKGPYNTIQASGTVVNHYSSLWYVVPVNGVDYYVFSDNVVASVPTPSVSFNANGGSVATSTKTVTYGSTYGTLPTPTRIGYSFNGWYTSLTGGSKISSSTTVSNASNHTLYAQWAIINYTVSFNANGGSVSTSSKTVTYGSTYGTLPTPSLTGYTFNGWYTALSGGFQITSSSTVSNTANHTLYAQWTTLSNLVFFDANGGSVATSSTAFTYPGTYGTLPTPTRSGYIFTGWYTAQSGGSLITTGTTISNGASHTLYAQWSPDGSTISVGNIERLTATRVSPTSIKLTWRKALNATGYHIYRSLSANGTYTYLRTIYDSSISYMLFTNTGLANGVTYYYKVLAFNKIGTTVTKGNMSDYVFAKTY